MRIPAARIATALGAFVAAASPAFAQSPAEFFKDKTVTFYVGLSAGGGYDVNARLVAKHIGKYIPGNPQVIVRNMPGGGGLVMTNYVANVAAKDGLHIGAPQRGIPFEPLLRRSLEREVRRGQAQLDRQRQHRHQRGGGAQAHRRQDLAGPARRVAKDLIVAGTGIGTESVTVPYVLRNLLGFKYRVDRRLSRRQRDESSRCCAARSTAAAPSPGRA